MPAGLRSPKRSGRRAELMLFTALGAGRFASCASCASCARARRGQAPRVQRRAARSYLHARYGSRQGAPDPRESYRQRDQVYGSWRHHGSRTCAGCQRGVPGPRHRGWYLARGDGPHLRPVLAGRPGPDAARWRNGHRVERIEQAGRANGRPSHRRERPEGGEYVHTGAPPPKKTSGAEEQASGH